MEAEVIKRFLPDLVKAVGDCVQITSDLCFSKGLITETTHTAVLKPGDTNPDKARTLILALRNRIERDTRCFKLFLNILDEVFPNGSDDSLLITMRKFCAEEARGVISNFQTQPIAQHIPSGSEFLPLAGHDQQVPPNIVKHLNDNSISPSGSSIIDISAHPIPSDFEVYKVGAQGCTVDFSTFATAHSKTLKPHVVLN